MSSWTIAIHGGAGTITRDTPEALRAAHLAALDEALRLGVELLADGRSALDVAEAVVVSLEEAPPFNAGRGAVFNADGEHEHDASVMTDEGRAGAVCAVRTVRNPVKLARLVMERTRHVLLAGEGAERFADTTEVERVDNAWFDTEARRAQWERVKAREGLEVVDAEWNPDAPKSESGGGGGDGEGKHGTVGAAVLDAHGRLAAATSTGGLTNKRWGRVGDSPVPGAGVWADRRCALSGTGIGERFLRGALCARIAHRVELLGESVEVAGDKVFADEVQAGTGGVVGVDAQGRVAMSFNSLGMYRGAADARGRFEVEIW